MNWMDIGVIIIIVISALRGLSIGLILSFFNIASYIVAGIIAKIYYPFLTEFIMENTTWFFKIQQFVLKNMRFLPNNNLQNEGVAQENLFEKMNLPKILEKFFIDNNAFNQYSEEAFLNINIYISQMIAKIVVDLLSIIIIFIAAKIALNILAGVLNGIASLPIIKQFNRLGGLVFGVLQGLLIVFIFAAIMVPIASVLPNSSLISSLEASSIAKPFYDYNILLYMIKSFVGYNGSQMMNSI